MRKNFLAICIMTICALALAGCSDTKETETTKESQAVSETVESEMKETVLVEEQKTSETARTELQESSAATVPEMVVVAPLPVTIDMEHLDNCTVAISLEEGDVYVDDTGAMQMDVTVFVYDLYDMVDIALLEEGDTIVIREEEVKVSALERSENGKVIINGGLDVGGYELYTDDDTVFYERGYSDVKSYYELGKATLSISAEFTYTDASDLDKDAVVYPVGEFLAAGIDYHFNPNNTIITIQDGVVVEMKRVYIP